MSEKRRKLNLAGGTVLACAAAGALAAACDAPMPTELRDAIEEVMVDRDGQHAHAQREAVRAEGWAFLRSERAPLLYVDGVRVRAAERLDDVPEPVRGLFEDPMRNEIERIEVLKGLEATKLFGEEAAGGVIQIFTKELQTEDGAVAGAQAARAAAVEERRVREEPATPSPADIRVRRVREEADRRATLVEARRARQEAKERPSLPLAHAPVRGIVYIDGVRVDSGARSLAELLPEDIDRIEVVAGPRARELYGNEGADGVIRVFTNGGGGHGSARG